MRQLLQFRLTNVKALQLFHLLRQGATILAGILLTKTYLDTGDIGSYEQLLYIGSAVSFFWVAGLVQAMLSAYPDYAPEAQQKFLFNAYLLFLLISFLLFVGLYVFKDSVALFLTGRETIPYFSLFLVYLLVNMPTFLLENLYLLLEKPRAIVLFALLTFGGHLLVLLLPLALGYAFIYSFYGLIILAVIKHIWLVVELIRYARFHLEISMLTKWLVLATPLMLYALLGGLLQTFDNWLVNYWFDGDPKAFAIFRYGARELPLALALAHAFGTAMIPELRKDLKAALWSIREKSRKLFHLLFPFSIALMLTSNWWFPLIFNADFIESVPVFNAYLLILSSRLIFSRTILIGLQDNATVLVISLFELGMNVFLSFLFIQYWGLLGVAVATVIAFALEKLLICWYLHWKYRIALTAYLDLKWWLGYSVGLGLAFLWAV